MAVTRPRLHNGSHPSKIVPIFHANDVVGNCLDDNSAGSLRSVVTAAANGDTIDLSGLGCSTITLTHGAISIGQTGLIFQGPTPVPPAVGPTLTIDGNGGAGIIYSSQDVTINNLGLTHTSLVVTDGTASGGCVYTRYDTTLNDSTVTNCSATGARATGGAIYSYYGAVTVTNSTISGNTVTASTTSASTAKSAQAAAGGVYSYAALTVTGSTISDNSAVVGTIANPAVTTSAHSFGGGISISRGQYFYSPANDDISNSTISGNSAEFAGGVYAAGEFTLTNTTVSGNTASINGGGLRALYTGTLYLQNSTIAFNTGGSGGGVVLPLYGTATFNSLIVSNNVSTYAGYSGDVDAFNTITVAGANNLVMDSDATTVTFASAPITSDPLLAPLANNGGPTQTHALKKGSPAIDTGNNVAALATDQRGVGFPRTIGPATDIGAFELDLIFADGFEGP